MVFDFLTQSHSLLATAHKLLDLFKVVFLTGVLVLLNDLHARSAVAVSHMLNEVGSIPYRFTLQSVDERTVTFVETVGATNLNPDTQEK